MSDLIRLRKETYGEELYDVGAAFNLAMNEPKKLRQVLHTVAGPETVGQAQGMIAIPGKNHG